MKKLFFLVFLVSELSYAASSCDLIFEKPGPVIEDFRKAVFDAEVSNKENSSDSYIEEDLRKIITDKVFNARFSSLRIKVEPSEVNDQISIVQIHAPYSFSAENGDLPDLHIWDRKYIGSQLDALIQGFRTEKIDAELDEITRLREVFVVMVNNHNRRKPRLIGLVVSMKPWNREEPDRVFISPYEFLYPLDGDI